MSTTTSTNTPYSSSNTSSSPMAPQDYVQKQDAQAVASGNESGFSFKEVLIYGGSLVVTAIITYFSTLISVNSDISNNRENILVLKTDVSHVQRNLESAERDINKNESVAAKVGIIEVKVSGLQKQLDAHIDAVNQ